MNDTAMMLCAAVGMLLIVVAGFGIHWIGGMAMLGAAFLAVAVFISRGSKNASSPR